MCSEMNKSASSGVGHRGAVFQGHETIILTRQDNLIPISFLSLTASFLAMLNTTSFSAKPPAPIAPGSLPPCPGSRTIFAQIAHGRRRGVGFLRLRHRPARVASTFAAGSLVNTALPAFCPRSSMTRRYGSVRRNALCAPRLCISRTTRTTSALYWPRRTWRSRPSSAGTGSRDVSASFAPKMCDVNARRYAFPRSLFQTADFILALLRQFEEDPRRSLGRKKPSPVTRVLSAGGPRDVSSLFFLSSTRCERSPAARVASVLFSPLPCRPLGSAPRRDGSESKDATITSAQKPPRTTDEQIFAFFHRDLLS